MIQDSSNGSDLLTQEIKHSEGRLRAVKSGVPLDQVVPQQDASFYIPDVETYFKGKDRTKRKKGLAEDMSQHEQVKFFITETNLTKPVADISKSRAVVSDYHSMALPIRTKTGKAQSFHALPNMPYDYQLPVDRSAVVKTA